MCSESSCSRTISQTVDQNDRAVTNRGEHTGCVFPCPRRGKGEAVIELVDHDRPAALAQPGDDATVVLVAAGPALERARNDEGQ